MRGRPYGVVSNVPALCLAEPAATPAAMPASPAPVFHEVNHGQ